MHIVHKNTANKVNASPSTTIWEYLMDEESMSGALTSVNGRYPEKGFAVNELSKELVYILSGQGKILSLSGEEAFQEGDVVFVDRKEPFAWEGTFSMFMATTPTFDPKQHRIVSGP